MSKPALVKRCPMRVAISAVEPYLVPYATRTRAINQQSTVEVQALSLDTVLGRGETATQALGCLLRIYGIGMEVTNV